ncbi:MAG: serine hydrolase domain-containing protein [Vulcanimicrobiaceae bacterium]
MLAHTLALALAAGALSHQQSLQVDGIVRSVMHEQRIDGLSVGVVIGSRDAARAYGFTDRSHYERVRPQTRFAIGSLSKAILAASARRLRAEGRLRFRMRVRDIDPAYRIAGNVTLATLLAQRSGIPDYAQLPDFNRFSREPQSPQALVARVADLPLLFRPGSQTAYSNTNYVLAGMALQEVTALPLAVIERDEVFTPLGMRETRTWQPFVFESQRAWGNVAPGSPTLAFGAADLESSATDLDRWMTALLSHRMSTGTIGFWTGKLFGFNVMAQSGYINGFSAYMLLAPQRRSGVVILCNADRTDLGPLAQSVLAAALGIPD